MSTDIPYQAYKSKRHSRNLSSASFNDLLPKLGDRLKSVAGEQESTRAIENIGDDGVDLSDPPSSPSHKSVEPAEGQFNEPSPTSSTREIPPSPTPSTSQHRETLKPFPVSRVSSSRFRHVPFRSSSSGQTPKASLNIPVRPSPLAPHSFAAPISPRPTAVSSLSTSQVTPPSTSRQYSTNSSPQGQSVGGYHESQSLSVLSPTPITPSRSHTQQHVPPTPDSRFRSSFISTPPPPSSRPQSAMVAITSISAPTGRPAPYRSGFQPKGVCRHRTDDFLSARAKSRSEGNVEQQRQERRLEKIIELHFASDRRKARPPATSRRSSFFDLDFSDIKENGLWRGVVESRASQSGADAIREAEQMITPWQNDKEVAECPICGQVFHPLTNRKHHCRTCGRVICSLPVKAPLRPRRCSILFVADLQAGRVEEVEETVDYGVKRRGPSNKGIEENLHRGVRLCQDCRPVLLQLRYRLEANANPLILRLYQALISLEGEITEMVVAFEDVIGNLSGTDVQTLSEEAAAIRAAILKAFKDYESLSNRIRSLPTDGGAGSSQERIQKAISARANMFMQRNLFPLKALPKPTKGTSSPRETTAATSVQDDPDSALAHRLQPLLEQEAILDTFIQEARTRRKFDDVKTLSNNLQELQREIELISQEGKI